MIFFYKTSKKYAVINESWRLVQDGVMSPQDVDTVLFGIWIFTFLFSLNKLLARFAYIFQKITFSVSFYSS